MLETPKTSHVPTADRVAQLFRGCGTDTASDSGSDSEDDAPDVLEEIDFADLAQVRAEVDAIAQGTATTTTVPAAHEEEHMVEVDFADLAAIRAKVDAEEPQPAPQDATIEETFTGVYNQTKHTVQASDTTNVVNDDKPHDTQQTTLSSIPILNDLLHLKPSVESSNPSNHESSSLDLERVLVEDESSTSLPVEEPPVPTAPETHLVTSPTDDIPIHPDVPCHDDPHPLFVIDTTPTRPLSGRSASDVILVDRTGHGETLGDQDDERIVYIAPHPRSGPASPILAVPRVKLSQTSMLTGKTVEGEEVGGLRSPVREENDVRAGGEEEPCLSLASLTLEPATSESTSAAGPSRPTRTNAVAATLRARKKEAHRQRQRERKNKRGQLGFGAYGAMLSEVQLREGDGRERRHPRWETRRRGDSDVDWGTADEDEEEEENRTEADDSVNAVSDGLGGMEIDPDLEMDLDAMQRFVKSMSAQGSQFVTMDDIEDEARMRQEDEEGHGGPDGSSASEHSDEAAEVDKEEEEVFDLEEKMLIAESESDEELSEDSDDDDDMSPRSSFQAGLRKIRERSRGQDPKLVQENSDEEEEDVPEVMFWTRTGDGKEVAHTTVSRLLTVLTLVRQNAILYTRVM